MNASNWYEIEAERLEEWASSVFEGASGDVAKLGRELLAFVRDAAREIAAGGDVSQLRARAELELVQSIGLDLRSALAAEQRARLVGYIEGLVQRSLGIGSELILAGIRSVL